MRAALALALVLAAPAALAQGYGGGGYSPPAGGAGDLLAANNLSDVDDAATSLANLGTLPAFRVCSTCAYTTISSAITAASAGGGVVKVAPGTYTEALTAAAGVHLLCDVPSAQVKACRITGTPGNPAITYDIGTPGGAREDHVSLALGFLLVSGGGVGVPAVSVECPVAAAQRVELYEVDLFSADGSGQALRMTCGATDSGGLETVARIHGDLTQINSLGGSAESVVYHSGGWLDFRGYIAIDADSGDDVALEVAAAGAGTVTVADFLLTGTVQVGAAATTAVTLYRGIISTATAAPITTNGAGALSIGAVGLWAVAAAPAACVAGAGVVVHAPTSLGNLGNCGTLIAGTVNGGAGPDFAGAFVASRLQQELLGTAALLDVGTGANNVVQLDGSSRLPAVDGSQLTNLPGGSTSCITNAVAPTWYWDPLDDARGSAGEIVTYGYPGANAAGDCGYVGWASNGGTSYYQISSADFGRPASYTILVAYQPQSNTTHWILGSGNSSNLNFLGVIRNNSGSLGTYYGDNTQFTLSEVAAAFTVGVWTVIAVRYSNGDDFSDIWLDGVKQSPTHSGTRPTSTGLTAYAFSVGRLGTFAGNSAIANIGPVYFWESALSDAQVEAESALLEAAFGI